MSVYMYLGLWWPVKDNTQSEGMYSKVNKLYLKG